MATIGIKDLRFVELIEDTDSTLTYDTVIEKLAPAMEVGLEPTVASAELYADDVLQESASVVSKVEIVINVSELSLEKRAKLLGNEVVNGVLREKNNAIAPYVAVAFKSELSNGKYKHYWVTKAKAEPIGDNAKTKEDGIEYQTDNIKLTGSARIHDGEYRLVGIEGETSFPADWYTLDVLTGKTILP